jgi:hypothetical protein
MGWDRRGYYYRVKRVNGRVVREYVGGGKVAELLAQMDELEREKKQVERAKEQAARDEDAARERPLEELVELTELLARAALRAAGYHRHKRCEWRKARARTEDAG